MSKPLFCMIATLIEIPLCALIFLELTSFWYSIAGLILSYTLSRGWMVPAITMI